MFEGNLLIRASAGTGKTFSLATRYLRLMLLDQVDPERIVALTFSRAAAQEIYTKILERLWKAAESDAGADKESREICKGLEIVKSWSHGEFAALLRRLLDVQHLGTIATLDSFILRMVRNFPLETGFQHAVEVLDPSGEGDAVQEALREILNGTRGAAEFIKTFSATQDGNLPRVLQYKIKYLLQIWRSFIEHCPDCRTWTVESMCAALGVPEKSECPDLSDLPFCQSGIVEQFVRYCATYDGSTGIFDPPKGVPEKVAELMLHFVRNPDADSYPYKANRRHYVFDCGREGAEKIRAAIRHLFNVYVRRQLTKVKAKLDFVGFVEDSYNRIFRRKGKLTFSDFTGISAAKGGSNRALALENLEYRFDEKFEHWALDEFQDTSEVQWACLRNLVDSAASGNGRTVMTVGDLKQSIYTWRGGNDAPFKEMMSWKSFADAEYGRIADSDTSYRYEKNICDFVNSLFGPKNLRTGGPLLAERGEAVERWLSPDCWKEHQPDCYPKGNPKAGQPKANDYVKVIRVADPNKKANIETLLPALEEELQRVWDAHETCGSEESVGILVRKNEDGNAIAEYLRAKKFPVVWEGLSAVSDVPAVNALIDLLRLSEHPEDTFAWKTVSQLFPICSTLFGRSKEDPLNAKDVSFLVAESLSQRGLSRTLQEYCQALSADSVGLDELSKQRLREIVRLGVVYEQRKSGRFSIDGFESFLAASSKRELGASSRVVRILTIHRSKGLTLDRVFIPLPEGVTEGIANPGNSGVLHVPGGKWVLEHLSADAARLNPETARAWNAKADEKLLSSIRMYYVALTRARKAMYIIEPHVEANPSESFFRDLINSAFFKDGKEKELVFEKGTEPAFAAPEGKDNRPLSVWNHDQAAEKVRRVSPSSAGHSGLSFSGRPAADFFGENVDAAAKRGIEIHGQYEKIEWADEEALSDLPSAFRIAFAKPSPDATVWRERSYEIYRGENGQGEWETGQFDRVVFFGTGSDRKAVIYDFKTNALREGESVAEFEDRIRKTYEGQMTMYVAALAQLTGIPRNRIEAKLLATASKSVIDVL